MYKRRKQIVLTVAAILVTIAFAVWNQTGSAQISIVGDVLLDRGVKEAMMLHGNAYPFESVSSLLADSDVTVGNLEGPITESKTPVLKKGNLIFKSSPSIVPYLYRAGFTLFNLANNHSMDYGTNGLRDTLKSLEGSGIGTFGGGRNQRSAEKPNYVKVNGMVIGFLGFSAFPPEGYFCFEDRPDVAHLEEDRLRTIIQSAKGKCDFLIVMFHWGTEFSYYAGEHQKTIARLACDSGADIIVGHHPHVLQGVEKYNGKFIIYSLGNFIFDRQIPKGTDETGILKLIVMNGRISKISLIPVMIEDSRPRTCSRLEKEHIFDRLCLYSKGLGVLMENLGTEISLK